MFSKNHFNKMSTNKLIANSKIIGDSAKDNGFRYSVKVGQKTIDLRRPISSQGAISKPEAVKNLKIALNQERVRYGKEMMKAAVTEDFKSTLANWKRVLLGTAIMNIRTSIDIARGHEMDPTDIMTSLMIGAFLNRKGVPLSPEMNIPKMQKLRRGLHAYGIPQQRLYDTIPTLHESQFSNINPLTDRTFKKINRKAEELNLVGDTPEAVEVSNSVSQKSPSLAATQRAFPLFDKYYQWLQAASPKKYIKPKALITEAEAKAIEASIRANDFDGVKINTVKDFDFMMKSINEKIIDNVESNVIKTAYDVIKITDWGPTKTPEGGDLGTVPKRIVIDQKIQDLAEAGKIKGVNLKNVQDYSNKANNVLEAIHNTMKGSASENPQLQNAVIRNEAELSKLIEVLNFGEASMIKTFNVHKRGGTFDFNDLSDLIFPVLHRRVQKGHERFGNFFSDTENPIWNDQVLPQLEASGLIQKDPNTLTGYKLLAGPNVTVKTAEGVELGNANALKNSVLGILGAKGNKSLSRDNQTKAEVSIEQMQKLDSFLTSNKIITQKELLDFFRADVTQKIFVDIARDTKIDGKDISVLNQLAGLGIPLAEYSTLGDGGTGFLVKKIDMINAPKDKRTREYKAIKEYNDYVDGLLERGTSRTTKKKLIDEGDTINFRDHAFGKNEALVLRDIIRRAGTKAQQNAQETLIDFVKAMDPSDPIHIGVKKYFEGTNDPDALFNFLQGEGLITTKKKRGSIDYVLNADKLTDESLRPKIEEWLQKFGVKTSDIEKMVDAANMEVESYMNKKSQGNHGTLTQQDYFNKYFPDATGHGSKYGEAEVQKQHFDKALLTKNPMKALIESMEVKVGKDLIPGKDIFSKPEYAEKLVQVKDDTQKMLVLRNGSVSTDVLMVGNNKVIVGNKNVQKNPFINFLQGSKIPFVFVDGELFAQVYTGKRLLNKSINAFDMESPHSVNSYSNTAENKKLVKNFYDNISKHDWAEGKHKGVVVIRMGNAKDALAVPRTSFAEVTELFRTEIFKKFAKSSTGRVRDKIESMMNTLEKANTWTEAHEDAMRSIVVKRMVTGKGNENKFLDIVGGTSEGFANLGKRFSLYHTPSFKRMDKNLMLQLAGNSSGADKKLLKDFSKRDVGFIVWNDEGTASIKADKKTQKILRKKGTDWTKMLGNREDASGFDSISFISADFKRILELYYGVSGKGSNVFKPVISSTGKDYLMLGKTVFVHDPDIQADIFGKHKGLDILMTKSADKMKSSISDAEWANLPKKQQDRIRYIDKDIDGMLNITGKEISEYIKTMNMDKIGVTIIPDVEMNARQSYSLANFMNNTEHAAYYDAFYKGKIDQLLGASANSGEGILRRLTQDNLYKRISLLKIKGADLKTSLEDLANSPQQLKNLGHHLQIAAMGGDVSMMGEHVLHNTLKSQFLDPILSPESITPKGDRYGGKAVIKQSFKFRDLDISVRTGEGKEGPNKTKVDPGEIMLPDNARSGSIDFKGSDIVLKVVGPKGEIRDAKDLITEYYEGKPAAVRKARIGKPIYEVKVDMFEHPTLKSGDGDAADVWVVNSLAQAKAQLKAIRAGRGKGKKFRKIKKVGPGEWVLETKGHQDDKLIFLKGKEPANLLPDPGGRVKGGLYRKEVIKADKNWDYLQQNGNLGMLHDAIESLFKGKWQLGILTTRYPRTAPNDLAVLKLKGFLKKRHGNTSIVNDFDVLNIFEGDYDVDEVDFFWGMNRKGWDHIDRVKHHWVNTVDKSHYKSKTPDLTLMDGGVSNSTWKEFDANNRVFQKGVGIVQKTPRLLSHLDMIGVKNTEKGSAREGMRDLIRYRNKAGEEVIISMDYDNSNYFERMALETQLIIDYWKGVSPDIVNGMVDWRNDYLFPRYVDSITKDQVPSLADRSAMLNQGSKSVENRRIRIFRKFVNGKEGSQYDLLAQEKALIQHQLSRHSEFLSLTTEVYDNSGKGKNPSYNDLFTLSNDYFNGHLKDISKSSYNHMIKKFGRDDVIMSMFKPHAIEKSSYRKKIDYLDKYPNEKNDKEATRIRTDKQNAIANQVASKWTYLVKNGDPFFQGVKDNALEISKSNGQTGSVMERVYREILHRDPFGNNASKGNSEVPLSGKLYEEMMAISHELLSPKSGFDSHSDISNIIPKMTGKFNEDVKIIKHYKRTIMWILNNKSLKQETKDKRVAALKDIIAEKEAGIKELLPKKYLNSKKSKDLDKIKIVDITRDKDVIEGTVQWYTMHGLADRYGITRGMNTGSFVKDLIEVKALGAKSYNEFTSMGETLQYGNNTIHDAKLKQMRLNPNVDRMDVESQIAERLERGYRDYKMPFLIEYAMPQQTETTIGLYHHREIPVSLKASGRLKRTVKFMLDKMNSSTNKVERLALKEALEVIVKRYSTYKNFFDGNFDAIPVGDADFMNMMNNPPGFSDNLKTVFDRYERVQIQKGKFAEDVFGMGSEYDSNVMFYRRLMEEGLGSSDKIALREATSTLSYTNQLLMENNYMDPISYYLNVKNLRAELERLGLDKAETMGIDGGEISPTNIHAKESTLAVLAGERSGVSVRPSQMLTDYKLSMIKKYIKQSQDMKKNEKSTKEWSETKEEFEKAGWCKPAS